MIRTHSKKQSPKQSGENGIVLDHPLIVGGGIVGMVLALGLRQLGLNVTLLDGADGKDTRLQKTAEGLPWDLRTVALWQGAVNFLHNLGVWDTIVAKEATPDNAPVPLETLRLITPTHNGAAIANQVDFNAHDLNLESLGYNVPVAQLQKALIRHCKQQGVTLHHNSPIKTVDYNGTAMTVTTEQKARYTAPVVLSCEGRHSPIRHHMQIPTVHKELGLSALVCMVHHEKPHGSISQEIHHPSGPFTFVPMHGGILQGPPYSPMSALVWVDKTDAINLLRDREPTVFNGIMQDKSLNILGDVALVGERQIFPLSCQYVQSMGGAGYVLLGESAHVLPPFAAQGMNLSLRDVAEYLHHLQKALTLGQSMGHASIAQKYQKNRLPDIRARAKAVTVLHNMVFNTNPLLHAVRTKGMGVLNKITPLRQGVMAIGMQGVGGDPVKMKRL